MKKGSHEIDEREVMKMYSTKKNEEEASPKANQWVGGNESQGAAGSEAIKIEEADGKENKEPDVFAVIDKKEREEELQRVNSADQNYKRVDNFFKKSYPNRKLAETSASHGAGWNHLNKASHDKKPETFWRNENGNMGNHNEYLIRTMYGAKGGKATRHPSPKYGRREALGNCGVEKLAQDNKDTKAENNNLKKEIRLLKTGLLSLENELKQSYEKIAQLEFDSSQKEPLPGNAGMKKDSRLEYNLKCEIKELRAQLKKKEEEVSHLKKSTRVTKMNELENELIAQEDEMKKLMSVLNNKIELEAMARERAELCEVRIVRQELELQRLREANERMKSQIGELETRKKEQETIKFEKEKEKIAMEELVNELKRKVNQRNKDTQRQREEINRLRKMLDLQKEKEILLFKEAMMTNSRQESRHTTRQIPSSKFSVVSSQGKNTTEKSKMLKNPEEKEKDLAEEKVKELRDSQCLKEKEKNSELPKKNGNSFQKSQKGLVGLGSKGRFGKTSTKSGKSIPIGNPKTQGEIEKQKKQEVASKEQEEPKREEKRTIVVPEKREIRKTKNNQSIDSGSQFQSENEPVSDEKDQKETKRWDDNPFGQREEEEELVNEVEIEENDQNKRSLKKSPKSFEKREEYEEEEPVPSEKSQTGANDVDLNEEESKEEHENNENRLNEKQSFQEEKSVGETTNKSLNKGAKSDLEIVGTSNNLNPSNQEQGEKSPVKVDPMRKMDFKFGAKPQEKSDQEEEEEGDDDYKWEEKEEEGIVENQYEEGKNSKTNETPAKISKEEAESFYFSLSVSGKPLIWLKRSLIKEKWDFQKALKGLSIGETQSAERLNEYFEKSEDPETAWDELFKKYPNDLNEESEKVESQRFFEECARKLDEFEEETLTVRNLKGSLRSLGIKANRHRVLALLLKAWSFSEIPANDVSVPLVATKEQLSLFLEELRANQEETGKMDEEPKEDGVQRELSEKADRSEEYERQGSGFFEQEENNEEKFEEDVEETETKKEELNEENHEELAKETRENLKNNEEEYSDGFEEENEENKKENEEKDDEFG